MKGQILLIDDNPMDIKIASSALERSGFACFGFTEPEKAFAWLNENVAQIIFLDIQLNEISGFDLITRFRKDKATADTPIIMISGKNQIEDVKKAVTLGATDYIVKPLDPLILQEKVHKMSQQAESGFTAIDLKGNDQISAYFGKTIRILALSEFGAKIMSTTQVKQGESTEIIGIPKEVFGIDRVLARCLSCEKLPDQKNFLMQFTFVGLQEAQRQILRKACRQIWVRAKGGE